MGVKRVIVNGRGSISSFDNSVDILRASLAEAIQRVFGVETPVSNLEGHRGHTMAASEAIEPIAQIEMINRHGLIPSFNGENIDPMCKGIRPIQHLEKILMETAIKKISPWAALIHV